MSKRINVTVENVTAEFTAMPSEKPDIIINGTEISEEQWHQITLFYDKIKYYTPDVMNFIEESGNYTEALHKNKELIDDIIDTYANYRYDNNGGDPDENMDWRECLGCAIADFADELKPYCRKRKRRARLI